jgi:hypothetical protein
MLKTVLGELAAAFPTAHNPSMRKQCRECRTVSDQSTTYCYACRCQFSRVAAVQYGLSSQAKCRCIAILARFSVAMLKFFQG